MALGGFLIATICLFVLLRPRLAAGPPAPSVWRAFLAMAILYIFPQVALWLPTMVYGK